MMQDLLTEFGYSVLGPVGDLASALAVAGEQVFDGAVLDVNLQGSPIYPVADLLRTRGLPFLFITGYDAESLDRRYPGVTVLQKPVDPDALQAALSALGRSPATEAESGGIPLGMSAGRR